MLDYQGCFDAFCQENGLELRLCFVMPSGYETACGTFDVDTRTVFLNAARLASAPDWEQAFYLFHELRHAVQYLRPEGFDAAIRRSLPYILLYDGTCYKRVENGYQECRLEGQDFLNLYLGQPYERDANAYAYERARALFGDSEQLRELHRFWTPRQMPPEAAYEAVYAEIEKKIRQIPENIL